MLAVEGGQKGVEIIRVTSCISQIFAAPSLPAPPPETPHPIPPTAVSGKSRCSANLILWTGITNQSQTHSAETASCLGDPLVITCRST